MRSFALTAALAAGAAASPLGGLGRLFQRDLVTEYTYVTTTIFITPGQAAATTAPTSSKKKWQWYGGGSKSTAAESTSTSTTAVVVVPTSSSVAPPLPPAETTTTTTQAPAPVQSSTVVVPVESSPAPSTQAAAAPSTTTQAAAASTVQVASDPSQTYISKVINHHNVHRANHSAPDVKWSQSLADTAKKIAQKCVYAHDVSMDGGGFGQNIAAGAHEDNITSVITNLFYNGEYSYYEPYYGQPTPQIPGSQDDWNAVFDKFGHFTQIVWKDTTEVGCYTQDCNGAGNGPAGLGGVSAAVPPYFTVCNYKNPGNYLGEFDKNVQKALGNPGVNWDYKFPSS